MLPAKPRRDFVRWRALTATFVTLVVLAGVDTIFPRLKYWSPSDWRNKPAAKPFQWSDVSSKSFHQSSTRPPACISVVQQELACVSSAIANSRRSIILEIEILVLVAFLVSEIQSSTIILGSSYNQLTRLPRSRHRNTLNFTNAISTSNARN